jgi:VWFA-related protein
MTPTRSNRNPTVKLLIFLFLVGLSAFNYGQTEQESTHGQITGDGAFNIRADVNLVTTDVAVIGAAPSKFEAKDFVVLDNKIAQQISYFSQDQIPLAVAILIDVSPSIRQYLPVLQIAGITALRRLKPGDQTALFSFAHYYERLSDLTEDKLLISEKISEVRIGSGTNIFDSLFDAAHYLKDNAPQRRRAIILISDNGHNVRSRKNAKDCRNELLETATTLYDLRISGMTLDEPDRAIKQMAKETGGEVFDVDGATSLKAALEKAVLGLRMEYTLGFSPSHLGAAGTYHKLDVRFADNKICPKCILLARSGYIVGVTAPFHPDEEQPISPPSLQKMDRSLAYRNILIAGMYHWDLDEISFKTSTTKGKDAAGSPILKIDIRIDPAAIDFSKIEDQHACRVYVAIFYADENGALLGSKWWLIEDKLDENAYQPIRKGQSIPYSTTIPIKAGNQMVKVVIYDERSDKVGSRYIQLED